MIPYEGDTLVTITEHQYDVILFSFTYIKGLEKKESNYKLDLVNLEKEVIVKDSIISLRNMQMLEADTIQTNFETIITKNEEQFKKKKRKRDWTIVVLSTAIAALIAERTYHVYQDLTK